MPLNAERYHEALLPSWTCKYCERALKEHIEAVEKAKFYEQRHKKYLEDQEKKRKYASQFERKAYRFIDFYFPSGKKFRKLYVIQERCEQGKVLYADLQEVTQSWRQIALERSPVTKSSYQKLKIALEKELDSTERPGWIIDRTHPWQADSGTSNLKEIVFSDASSYNFELVDNKWQKVIEKYRCTVCGKFVDRWAVKHEQTKTCICTQCY
jgi:hypothetical protein